MMNTTMAPMEQLLQMDRSRRRHDSRYERPRRSDSTLGHTGIEKRNFRDFRERLKDKAAERLGRLGEGRDRDRDKDGDGDKGENNGEREGGSRFGFLDRLRPRPSTTEPASAPPPTTVPTPSAAPIATSSRAPPPEPSPVDTPAGSGDDVSKEPPKEPPVTSGPAPPSQTAPNAPPVTNTKPTANEAVPTAEPSPPTTTEPPPPPPATVETPLPTVAPPQAVELPSSNSAPLPIEIVTQPTAVAEVGGSKTLDTSQTRASDDSLNTGITAVVPVTTATATISGVREVETVWATPAANVGGSPSSTGESQSSNSMGPLAERLLIAAGAIGAFVMLLAAIYFFIRLRHKHLLGRWKEKSNRSRSGAWQRRRKASSLSDAPPPLYSKEPTFSEYQYASEQKSVPTQREMDAFYSLPAPNTLTIPAHTTQYTGRGSNSQEAKRKPTGLRKPLAVRKPLPTQAQSFYYHEQEDSPVSPMSPSPSLNNVLTQNGIIPTQPYNSKDNITNTPEPPRPIPVADYNNTGTQVTFISYQNTNLNSSNQWEPNRMSQLSSLSSGFGDGLIIPEGGGAPIPAVAAARQSRQSRNQRASRFSWQTSNAPRTPRRRSELYSISTTSSVESAPRFRTVTSWVAQQTGRVEKQVKNGTPAVPEIPLPLRPEGGDHNRKDSEHTLFRHHPGDEIPLPTGSRIPSSILDKHVGRD